MRKFVWVVLVAVCVAVIGGVYVIRMLGASLHETFENVASQLDEAAPPGTDLSVQRKSKPSSGERPHERDKARQSERERLQTGEQKMQRKVAEPRTEEKESDKKNAGDAPFKLVQVFYATDRNRTMSDKPGQIYGVDRSELTYGICEVSIPRDHRLGQLEGPSIWKFEFREDPEKHVVLLKVEEKDHDAYFKEIANRVGSSTSKSAFLFVHGYNVTFEDAARRTAQMAYDLKFDGAPVFYSWPSQGSSTAYTVDENNVEWTELHLETFLAGFIGRSTADKIYLVAHSMGSRALTKAIATVADKDPSVRKKIEAIILAAPDIDADVFKQKILPRIRPATKNLTLYASSRDLALVASKQVHGYSRAGEVGPDLVVTNDVDTIDATSVDTSFIGHAYYAEAKSIIADLFEILRYQRTAKERRHLESVDNEYGNLWVFKASAKVLKEEPQGSDLAPGEIRYIDDGSCGTGFIKKIIEGDAGKVVPRSRVCVPN